LCEYPYVDNENLQFIDSTNCLVERPLFRSPKGICVPNAKTLSRYNNAGDYEIDAASNFYVADSLHSIVHNFQHTLKGPRGFSNTKSNELYVKRAYQWSFGSRGSMPGEFCDPVGIAGWNFDAHQEHLGGNDDGDDKGSTSSIYLSRQREHIVVADKGNNRIQCFVRIVTGAQRGMHFECMYPEDDDTHNSYYRYHGVIEEAMKDLKESNASSSASDSSLLKSSIRKANTLLEPTDVSVKVVNGVVMIYVCDTGNHCIRVLIMDTEILTKNSLLERTYSSDDFSKIPQHTHWMYSYDPNCNNYIRTVARSRLILVATWYGNDLLNTTHLYLFFSIPTNPPFPPPCLD
jgi:hypothetical protein